MRKPLISILVFLSLMLSGCASTLTTIPPGYQFGADSNEGIVLISLRKGGFKASSGSIAYFFQDMAGEHRYHFGTHTNIYDTFFPESSKYDGEMLAISLPAGKYQLTSWQATFDNVMLYQRFLLAMPFEVVAGRAIYLGRLSSQFKAGKNLFGINVVAGADIRFSNRFESDLLDINAGYPTLNNELVDIKIMHEGDWPIDVAALEAHRKK